MQPERRDFIKTASAAFTTSLFTGNVKGANDRPRIAAIGTGRQGLGNLGAAQKQENVEIAAVCDIYQPNLDLAVKATQGKAKAVKDFREILADKSIDVVCISTPDHWHAYMTVEACKNGKDVYVEKPVSTTVDEATKMLQAARKYERVVQAGTWQRSGVHFQKAVEIVKSGVLGKITFVRTWNISNDSPDETGSPADSESPSTLDWDMWLGPAPKRAFNANRFGVVPGRWSSFRWFWDYAGGMMTDWGVHWLDIVQMANNEEVPSAVTALGSKYFMTDNRDTPDTLQVTYEYPSGWVATYENRKGNAQSMFGKPGGILFCGKNGTLYVDRSDYHIIGERGSSIKEETVKSSNNAHVDHWTNFLQCVRTRQKPNSDIETCQRSTTTCLLGNVALRSKLRLDWDAKRWTTTQAEARKWLSREERKPWKIVV